MVARCVSGHGIRAERLELRRIVGYLILIGSDPVSTLYCQTAACCVSNLCLETEHLFHQLNREFLFLKEIGSVNSSDQGMVNYDILILDW
ncbi:hypothetical protein VNO77_12781 [Canavalia gladiata]|uniref:Uncharacterized protein n=1 Tax=Canavalia gladiata TaxID=3824 RepID=A0AAN9M093_CANGL